LYVTGCFINLVAAELLIQPLEQSVIFLKERDVILTNDLWRVVVNLDIEPYEEVITTIKEDLKKVEGQKQEFTCTAELRQIEALLLNLESRLNSFKQILPRLDRRRGLFNLGGAVLRTLFGTATSSDVMSLHTVINELQSNQKDIVHSMENQVTYIKKLDTIQMFRP
jgi:mannitol-specific phosphotransferase system IIBC component